ncbi:hypothetical protein GBL_1005 [Geobacillus kaustophilus GBlys]|uniref:Lipopolysaccharide assembly protein A domain-containing protein n=7 Tax=Geobacillus TaxID=129337 RepID=U2Y828_GEOKU|nr:hypothetical protein GBL_1005 [Geobacillus kaustophilus GBlys]GAJ57629.1 hypothetical protein B23_0819 [Geobacillus thermoleovorans B23]
MVFPSRNWGKRPRSNIGLFGSAKGGETMKGQINVILALVLALIVALLAVANVEQVTIHYLVGETRLPLIIVILGSAVLGGLVVGMLGWVRLFSLRRQVKLLEREREEWTKNKAGNTDGESVSLEREG